MLSQTTLREWPPTVAANIWFVALRPIFMLTLAAMTPQKLRRDG